MKRTLTTKFVMGLAPASAIQDIVDGATKNLHIIVHPTGKKVWRWHGRVGGPTRVFTLGAFPKYSLADARRWAADINEAKLSELPLPPMTRKEKEAAKEQAQSRLNSHRTFDWLFELYMADEGSRRKSAPERRRTYAKDIKPLIGDKAIDEITHDDLAKILRAKKDAGCAVMSNNIQSLLRRVFRWAVTKGRDLTGLERDPAEYLVKLSETTARDRFLTDYEIGVFFRARTAIEDGFAEALTVALYTGMRRSEFFELEWREVDFKAGDIMIAGGRTKNGLPLILSMSKTVSDILRRRYAAADRGKYVFPAVGARGIDAAIAERDGSKAEKPYNTFSKNMKRLNAECQRLAALDGMAFPSFSIHDLRRTLSSGMHALKDERRRQVVPSDIVERILNHRLGGVRGVYNRHDYYLEKMDALNAWAAHLDNLAAVNSPRSSISEEFRARPFTEVN